MIVALSAACSAGSSVATENPNLQSGGSSPPSVVASDFESCKGLLSLEIVRETAGRNDIEIAEQNVNSGSAPANDVGLETMCIYEYVTPEIILAGSTQAKVSGPSMTLTGILFDSGVSAKDHYQFSLDGIRMMKDATNASSEITEGTVGDGSYLLTVDSEGVGSVIGLQVGPYMVSLHTTLPEGQAPLVGSQELVFLARTVQERFTSNR